MIMYYKVLGSNPGEAMMSMYSWHVVSRDSSPITVSAIFGPALRLSSGRKFEALCYHRNQHSRAEPSGWLYSSTTQCLTRSWALKTVDLSRITWLHPCRILIKRVDAPEREPHACSRTESTFIAPIICHTQRRWLVTGWYPHVITMARHLNKADITYLSRAEYIPNLSFSDHQFYELCEHGK